VVQGLAPGDPSLAAAVGAGRVLGSFPVGVSGPDAPAEVAAGAAMLVLADAELEPALAAAAWAAFAHAGQGPFAVRRVFVAGPLGARFETEIARRAAALRVGDPALWETEVGPLTDAAALDALNEEIAAAVAAGAKLRCGGPVEVPGMAGAFCAPVVLSGPGVPRATPGPALAVTVTETEEEALAAAREEGPWSAISVWTRDGARGPRVAADVEAGIAWINAHDPSLDPAALTLALHASVRRRPLGLGVARDARWHPYGNSVGPGARATARLLWGPESERLRTLLREHRPLLSAARRSLWPTSH
jgi:aldehyde dehydrogenase family protein